MEKMTIPLDVAQAVLWHFGDSSLGLEPGSFVQHLLRAITAADLGNRSRLAIGFPKHVAAVGMVQYDHDGLDRLRQVVKAAYTPGVVS